MKKKVIYEENAVDRSINSTQSVIGLYEMLAQAQQSFSSEHSAFVDRMSLSSNSVTKSDE
mgnify:CR=1 FL=1